MKQYFVARCSTLALVLALGARVSEGQALFQSKTPIEMTLTTNLRDLSLRETEIAENGSFLGNVEFTGSPGEDQGDYAGAFGGLEATDVAGVLWLHPIEGQNGIWEMGAFNIPRCDMAGSSPLCLPR